MSERVKQVRVLLVMAMCADDMENVLLLETFGKELMGVLAMICPETRAEFLQCAAKVSIMKSLLFLATCKGFNQVSDTLRQRVFGMLDKVSN